MDKRIILLGILMLSYSFALFAENEAASIATYSDIWKTAGTNATIDSVFTINITTIPDSVTFVLDGVDTPIPKAVPNDGADDSFSFSKLITWMKDNIAINGIHAQIYTPSGTYHFRDQIVVASNISLKGDGSDETELIFLIDADPSSTNMTGSDCKKDAILVMGEGTLPHQLISKAGIEDIKS